MTEDPLAHAARPGATGMIQGAGFTYEEHLRKQFEARFGPIPTGLPFNDVNQAFQGPFEFGMASVGAYPPPPPPEPPADVKAYLDKVAAEGQRIREEQWAARERARAERLARAYKALEGLEIDAIGIGRLVGDQYDGYDLEIGERGIIEALCDLDLDMLRGEDLGTVEVHIKFHGPEGKATP